MSDVEQNPSPDRHLYAGFMKQFDEARRTVAALDTVFRDGNVEAVQDPLCPPCPGCGSRECPGRCAGDEAIGG